MTKKELIDKLELIAKEQNGDPEMAHGSADDALIEYIGDLEVKDAYDSVKKWYA